MHLSPDEVPRVVLVLQQMRRQPQDRLYLWQKHVCMLELEMQI